MVRKKWFKNIGGFSLAEAIIAMAILGILGTVFSRVTKIVMQSLTKTQAMAKVNNTAQTIFGYLERDLYHANEIVVSSSTVIGFICDYSFRSDFNPKADIETVPDLILNERDPDYDDDVQLRTMASAADKWQFGYNLVDDDDDGTAGIDYQIKYYMNGDSLYKDHIWNGGAWGNNVKKIASGISTFTITYFGSVENSFGSRLDLGHDGLVNTNDFGERDGIIDTIEMDKVPPPQGDGDQNGKLDTPLERRYITSIKIYLELQGNADAKSELTIVTQVKPPMLPLKPLQAG